VRRAAIYIRVSTPRQAEDDKISLGEQELRERQYCDSRGHGVVGVYSDIASGATKKRPGFQQMLKDAQADKFDVIVAWKTDRLARGIYPCAALMEALENTNVIIETVAEPFDRTTFEIRAVLGRIELENIAQRTQMGREGNIKAGNNHIRPPFGWDYDPDTKRWVKNDFEAKWVCQIFEWYIAGVSLYEIATKLNPDVPTKNHSRLGWTAQKVSELVNSECYTGVAYYNKRRGANNKPKDKSQWIPMSVPSIISQETWQAAQAKRQSNKRFSPRNTKAVYLTQRILACGECGKSFLIHSGNGQARLVCRGMTLHPHLYNCRNPKAVRYQPIADRLWEGVKAVLESEGGLQAAIQSRMEYVVQRRGAIEKRLKELTHKRDNLKLEQDRVISWARQEIINEQQLKLQLSAIQAQDEQHSTEIDSLLADTRLQGDAQTIYQQARQLIPIMQERLNSSLIDSEKQDIIKLLVRRALLDGGGNLTIEFSVPAPDSFAFATSLHAGLPGYRLGRGDVDEFANH